MLAKCILFFVMLLSLQLPLSSATSSCETRLSCGECISDPSVCVWCALDNFNGTRCKSQNFYQEDWCRDNLQNPVNFRKPMETADFSSKSDNVIQIKPQRYKLKLRPGKAETFKFSFKAAKNFPVDLYFLLDASKSMDKVKEMTASSSERIYLTIKNMTNNVHLGLGTFIDKRVLPFTNTFNTEQTYSFRHRLKLVDDFEKFKDVVSITPSGFNIDVQEGGLDALAQVMVCKDIIGWRNESRKIVVLLTDGPYHAAGDGKSAGLFQPYDGKCYTQNDSYTKEQEMDYPSVGMINKLATEHNIIVIFLVDFGVQYIYDSLSEVVSGSRVGTYYNGTMNNLDIVNTLEDIYKTITKKFKLNTMVKSGRKKNFQISFNPDCTNEHSGSECDVEVGKERELVGTVKLLDHDGVKNSIIDIVVEGFGDKLTLDIDAIKSCECENHIEENSTFCYGENRICGICNCSSKRYGDRCACIKSTNEMAGYNDTCIAPGSTDMCSGHGTCICGTCKCRPWYEGKFCECNMDSCPRGTSIGDICNGHGKCYCGKCTCGEGWSGDACDCLESDATCKGRDNSVCSNRGFCKCGACHCNAIGEWDARFQQDKNCQVKACSDCHEVQCRKLEDFARCQRNGQDSCTPDDLVKLEVVEKIPEEYLNSTVWHVCSNLKVEAGCYSTFVYRYNDIDYSVDLIVARDKDCAKTYYMFGGISLVVLLLIGVGTLIGWKLVTEARDRREYMQFLQKNKEDASGPSSNPLYEEPSTTFNNPTFRKKSVDFR